MTKDRFSFKRVILLVAVNVLVASPGFGEEMNDAESMLDKLEKHLREQESRQLTFGDGNQSAPEVVSDDEPVSTYKYEGTSIKGDTHSGKDLVALSDLIASLEKNVDALAADIQKTKQTVVDSAAIDNFITLEAQLKETDEAAIKNLTVKIDGYNVYDIHDAAGLWLPSKRVPLYAGPLQPGTHRVDVEARIALRRKDGLPLNDDIYRFVNKTFEFAVPTGKDNSTYVINIQPPKKIEEGVTATFKQAK